ncbi:unnamed protein product [Acanthocheilonema viteae]|uniref:Chitin-binding type-2 domain-containing protein n=1 Tax=Acanthocheilonema viteae TaxID=6277 RepID=A0A498SXC1_ACAVI|nr:unnamed protein product [Acanthocheilonema viteae]
MPGTADDTETETSEMPETTDNTEMPGTSDDTEMETTEMPEITEDTETEASEMPETTEGAETETTTEASETTETIKPTKKPSELKCPRPSGLFPHPDDCHLFLHCAHNYPHVMECPAATFFNEKYKVCDHQRNAPEGCV